MLQNKNKKQGKIDGKLKYSDGYLLNIITNIK
jgi:hypothetical protein